MSTTTMWDTPPRGAPRKLVVTTVQSGKVGPFDGISSLVFGLPSGPLSGCNSLLVVHEYRIRTDE